MNKDKSSNFFNETRVIYFFCVNISIVRCLSLAHKIVTREEKIGHIRGDVMILRVESIRQKHLMKIDLQNVIRLVPCETHEIAIIELDV